MTNNPLLTSEPPSPDEYLPYIPFQKPAEIRDCSLDLVVALASKGFVILTGQSGTGKSRSAIQLCQGLDGLDQYDNGIQGSSYELVPVGADWTDARPLIGYTNPFGTPREVDDGESTHVTYEIPDSLRLLLRAAAPSSSQNPYVLILDEMNLSHVERYFSPFLSLIEANRSSSGEFGVPLLPTDKTELIADVLGDDEPNAPETKAAEELVAEGNGLRVPLNLLVIGTVNVDETTYMFSPKVLDRAHVLEMHSIQPKNYFENSISEEETLTTDAALKLLQWSIESREAGLFDKHPREIFAEAKTIAQGMESEIDALQNATERLLDGAYKLLDPVGFGFGFRAINEVVAYLLCWIKTREGQSLDGWQSALDRAFVQKILPKIHGNRRQLGESLLALDAFLDGKDESDKPSAKYRLGGGEPIAITSSERLVLNTSDQMKKSRAKLKSMHTQLQATGYATFIR